MSVHGCAIDWPWPPGWPLPLVLIRPGPAAEGMPWQLAEVPCAGRPERLDNGQSEQCVFAGEYRIGDVTLPGMA